MSFNWEIDFSTLIAITALILSQYAMHRKNVELLSEMKVKVDSLWQVFMREHGLIDEE